MTDSIENGRDAHESVARDSTTAHLCTQPGCLLRGADAIDQIREIVLRAVSGDASVADMVAPEQRIARREVCRECLARVLEGRRPLPTQRDLDHVREAGRWTSRRTRRQRRLLDRS